MSADVDGTAVPGQGRPVMDWLRSNMRQLIAPLGLFVAFACFVIVVIQVIARGGGEMLFGNILAHTYVLAWLMLATLTVRTVAIRDVVTAVFSGFFLTTMISYYALKPLVGVLDLQLRISTIVPIVEELAKLVPLLLVLWAYHRKPGRSHGVSDFLVLGFAVGGGMTMAEDALYGRLVAADPETLFAVFHSEFGLLFPTFSAWGFTVLHSGWGAVIGLGLGIAALARRNRALALIALFTALGLAVLDHAASNYHAGGVLRAVFDAVLLNHYLLAIVLVLGIPGAIAFDLYRRRRRPPELPAPGLRLARRALQRVHGPLPVFDTLFGLSRYRLEWISAAYARAGNPSPPDAREDRGLIAWLILAFPPVLASASEQAGETLVPDSSSLP